MAQKLRRRLHLKLELHRVLITESKAITRFYQCQNLLEL